MSSKSAAAAAAEIVLAIRFTIMRPFAVGLMRAKPPAQFSDFTKFVRL